MGSCKIMQKEFLYLSVASCNQLQGTWDTVPYFGLNGLSMILCLWPPLHPFSKLLAIQDHAQNLEEQLWMGEGEVFYLTDLWLAAIWSKTGCFFVRVSQHFCNWLSLLITTVSGAVRSFPLDVTAAKLVYKTMKRWLCCWTENKKSCADSTLFSCRIKRTFNELKDTLKLIAIILKTNDFFLKVNNWSKMCPVEKSQWQIVLKAVNTVGFF